MPELCNAMIHPRLLGSLSAFWPSLCNIEGATEVTIKGEVQKDWVPLEGHGRLPCRVAPAGGQEIKRADMTYTIASHTILLAGHHPAITPKMRAVVGSITFDILAVEHDGQNAMTRLQTQVLR